MVKPVAIFVGLITACVILVLFLQLKMTLECEPFVYTKDIRKHFANDLKRKPHTKQVRSQDEEKRDNLETAYLDKNGLYSERIDHFLKATGDDERDRKDRFERTKVQQVHTDRSVIHNNFSKVVNCITGETMKNIPIDQQNYVRMRESIRDIDTHKYDKIRKSKFVEIFNNGFWDMEKDGAEFQRSGPGSKLENAQGVIAILHTLINEIKRIKNIRKVNLLDVPCGDMQWMAKFLKTRDDVIYTGIDIVPNLIDHHKTMYPFTEWEFHRGDIATTPLTKSYDLILCRMMLQHLALKTVLKILHNFSSSNSSYLLTTTFPTNPMNNDVIPGEFQRLNLEISPIGLKPPLCYHRDQDGPGGHYMGLWELPLQQYTKCPALTQYRIWDRIPLKIHTCSQKKKALWFA
ncbi:unnamed protein product [Owenia fusiformis]|uniref:Uncharacterized protein n=1 Tax=Owenia fusiformis TaxID=6347 RepID=A0A8J1V1N2_OWEFU|nr:unnamed protein product [Owenia fusiformis]